MNEFFFINWNYYTTLFRYTVCDSIKLILLCVLLFRLAMWSIILCIVRNIVEQCTEWQIQLIDFIDFEKAFEVVTDTVNNFFLKKIRRHYGIPSKIVDSIKAFFAEFKCIFGISSNTSFLVKSRARQECVSLFTYIAEDWVMRSTL